MMRNGNDVTLTGVLPDEAAKTSLLDSLHGLFGPNVNLIDKLTVKDGVNVPDLAGSLRRSSPPSTSRTSAGSSMATTSRSRAPLRPMT